MGGGAPRSKRASCLARLDSSRRRELARSSLTPANLAETGKYSYEQITSARDADVHPACKELYLTDDDFFRIFQMDKVSFYSLKKWKMNELKRRVGLF